MKTETTFLDYKICGATQAQYLCDEVHAAIAKGWKPIGGVAISFNEEYGQWFMQAMIKKYPLPRPEKNVQ